MSQHRPRLWLEWTTEGHGCESPTAHTLQWWCVDLSPLLPPTPLPSPSSYPIPSPHPPLQAHLEECGYKKVKCDLCHEGVLAHYIAQHMANECPERTGNCAIVMQETLNQHTSELVYGRENLRDMSVAQSGPPAGRGVEQQLLVMNQQLQKVMDRLDVRAAEIKQLKRWILGILSVQLQASLASSFTKNPWQIPNVGHRIQELKSSHVNSIYSPPYYTGCISYKMCLRVYLNGDGNLSATLFYVFTNGEDIVIEGPLEHKVGQHHHM